MTRNRTVPEKAADWAIAYEAIRGDITPQVLRQMLTTLTGSSEAKTAEESVALLQTSMALARLVCANDRAAAIAAAMLTSGGVSRPVIEDGE